jgi:hypothetical protein
MAICADAFWVERKRPLATKLRGVGLIKIQSELYIFPWYARQRCVCVLFGVLDRIGPGALTVVGSLAVHPDLSFSLFVSNL